MSRIKSNASDDANGQIGKEIVNDAKDAAKIAGNVASGNVVAATATVLKNRRIRRILIVVILGACAMLLIGFLLMASMMIGMSDLFRSPLMKFGQNQTITETDKNGQTAQINFTQMADAWEKNDGLTSEEVAQVNQLQLNLPYGLLEAFYEIGASQGTKDPLKTLQYVVQQLQPSHITFQPVKLLKVSDVNGKKKTSYVTQMVLQSITRYNGVWITKWHIATDADGSQSVVLDSATLERKDYTPLYRAEKAWNFLSDSQDQQALFGQALVLDPNFYDPMALPILQMMQSGSASASADITPIKVNVNVAELRYQPVSAQSLYDFVHAQGSIFTLSDIETIIAAAKSDDVSPVLMVAITGQEQSFVPVDTSDAPEIELNPFNVEGPGQTGPGSWMTYHVSLADSAQIAANTLANKLSVPPPSGENPIAWINDPENPYGIYATDPHWASGVAEIYQEIEMYLQPSNASSLGI